MLSTVFTYSLLQILWNTRKQWNIWEHEHEIDEAAAFPPFFMYMWLNQIWKTLGIVSKFSFSIKRI